jgi:hypothetical protein
MIRDGTERNMNKEVSMPYLAYGQPVMVTSGKHKGRIGMYGDEDEDHQGRTKAVVYFGSLLHTMRYQLILLKSLSDQMTTPALIKRIDDIPREIWRKPNDIMLQNDRLTELCLCYRLLTDRYLEAMERMHMKTEHKVFISHARKDLHLARAIATDLINDGFSVFLDDWSIDLGENIISRITEEIDESRSLIMLVSEDYLRSTYCNDEWTSFYMKFSKINPNAIYPIMIQDAEPPALLCAIKYARIRELDDYPEVYGQLIRAIKKRIKT